MVIDGQQRLTTLSLLLAALNSLIPQRTVSNNDQISLSYESRPESDEFLLTVAEKYAASIEAVKKNLKSFPSIKERIEQSKKDLGEPDGIDSRYMLNAYLYAYWFFYERIYDEPAGRSYFNFAKDQWKEGERLDPKWFKLFEEMVLDQTSIIWYEIKNENENEHKVFENFNSGKIELTSAELIKGIFMNPDNYLDKPEQAFFEKLKTRQIMLGGQWDEIERSLHNPHFWDFIPHLSARDDEDKYPATRIDAILDMYVYFRMKEGFEFSEDHFAFKKINEWISGELKKNEELTENKKDRFEIMRKYWDEIRDVYTAFLEWYNGDPSLPNSNSLYHRISLFRRIISNTDVTYADRYRTELREMKNLYNLLASSPKKVRHLKVNELIWKQLASIDRLNPADIKDLIRKAEYGNRRTVEAILIAFNLAALEGAKGYGGRFPFFTFKDEKWEKEHIFATNTVLSGEKKEFLEALISQSESDAYRNYQTFLQTGVFEDEQQAAGESEAKSEQIPIPEYDELIGKINAAIQESGGQAKQMIEKLLEEDGDVIKFLTGNHIGNMALLTKQNNIIVSKKTFRDKSREIKKMFSRGSFIPISTMNVFCDFYSEGETINESYDKHWLYEKRVPYLKQMIAAVTKYLRLAEELPNE
jgi:hypothetical protein